MEFSAKSTKGHVCDAVEMRLSCTQVAGGYVERAVTARDRDLHYSGCHAKQSAFGTLLSFCAATGDKQNAMLVPRSDTSTEIFSGSEQLEY